MQAHKQLETNNLKEGIVTTLCACVIYWPCYCSVRFISLHMLSYWLRYCSIRFASLKMC